MLGPIFLVRLGLLSCPGWSWTPRLKQPSGVAGTLTASRGSWRLWPHEALSYMNFICWLRDTVVNSSPTVWGAIGNWLLRRENPSLGAWPLVVSTVICIQSALNGCNGFFLELNKEKKRWNWEVDSGDRNPRGEEVGKVGWLSTFLCKHTLNCQRIKIYK